jgi:hypothetical protein
VVTNIILKRRNVKILTPKIMILLIMNAVLWAGSAVAQNVDYNFHWSPSPIIDGYGIVRPEAVAYEVYVRTGSASDQLLATVNDTTFVLSASPGVAHRLSVRAVDGEGRTSVMSPYSDPIYFESEEEDNRSVPGVPTTAELGPNYPNPFNPETRVVYGVPMGTTGDEPMSLAIYNIQGQLVRRLEVDKSPGWHEVAWDGKDESGVVASTGMYLTRFMVGTMATTAKMTMVK